MKSKSLLIGICALDVVLAALSVFLYMRQDRTVPVISFAESDNAVVYTEGMDTSLLLNGVIAMDEEDGDVSDTLLIEKISDTSRGDVIVTYAAMDGSNNVAKASRVFRAKKEYEAPVLQENGSTAAETESETESGTEADSSDEDGNEEDAEDGQPGEPEDGQPNEPEGGQPDEPEDRNAQNDPERDQARQQNDVGAEQQQAEQPVANQAPVLRLKGENYSVKAGTESFDWNECIRELSDDRDGRAELFANITMDGHVDFNTPGEYPVLIYTKDSDGAESEKSVMVVRVEE